MKTKTFKQTTDPRVLRAIVALERIGWTREEIMRLFDISLRTYFYRKAEIRRLKENRPMDSHASI